jgi:OTU domain-containing protein 6
MTSGIGEYATYCHALETTGVWGGQPEIMALSQIYACPIRILQMNAPPLVVSQDVEGPEILLAYVSVYG